MNVVTVCGSLSSRSANRSALKVAVRYLTRSANTSVAEAKSLGGIPAFRPDQDDQLHPSVTEFRELLESADVILLAAPEYAGGLAGSTKNALDWVVESGSLYHRVVAVISVGTTGGEFAIEQLVRTLSWQGALVVSVLGVSAPRTKTDNEGRFTNAEAIEAIEHWTTTAIEAAGATQSELLRRVGEIVSPYGIDPARFGDPSG